ncbi:MAG: hypothetical protein RL417_1553 [Pseudomonadota bacterium]|jgi:chromosome segregation protein
MRVSRIEIFGFKSFMDRLVLPLEGGVTGVVGPNGCGKSNIVDALRWVLGETRASSLRGGVLEDVIFNGTDKLRPLGLAEVTLTLRSNEANFFADLVSPALEAEFLAADVAIEEADAPITPVTPEEGGVGESLPTAAEEVSAERPKLTVIEGALSESVGAAESPQQASAEAPAEEKEGVSPTLLTRFGWLKSVNEVQITRRLYRSGESEFFINRVACRLKDLKDLFRAVGLGARAYTIVAQGEVSRIVTAKPEERRLIIEEAAGVLGFRDKIGAASRRLEETGINISRLDDLEKEVGRQVAVLKRQAARAEARHELKARIAELDKALLAERFAALRERGEAAQKLKVQGQQQEEIADAALKAVQAREQAARAELMSVDVESDELRGKIDTLREELNGRVRERADRQARINELRAFALARGTEIKRLEERRATLAGRHGESEREIAELKSREAALEEQIKAAEGSNEEDLRNLGAELHRLREALRTKEQSVREVRDRLISRKASLQSINEQLIAASPVTQLRKTLGEKRAEILAGFKAGLFVDGLTVPSKYSRAVQAVLAEKGEFLVSDRSAEIARTFIAEVVDKGGSHKDGVGLGVFRAGECERGATPDLPFPRVLEIVEVTPECRRAAERVFHGTYVVETLDAALDFFGGVESAPGVTLVTLQGDILTDYSFYSMRHDGGLVQLKGRARELEVQIGEDEAIQGVLHGEREALVAAIQAAEQKHTEALRESRARQAHARELSNQQGNVRGRLQAMIRTVDQSAQDLLKVAQQIKEAEARIEEHRVEEARIQASLQELLQENDAPIQAELTKLREASQRVDEVRKRGHHTLSGLNQELEAARRELDGARTKVSEGDLGLQKVELERASIRERALTDYGDELVQSLDQVLASGEVVRLDESTLAEYADEASKLKSRIAREGEVDPTSIERYAEENKRLEDLSRQKGDLEAAAQTLQRTIDRLTETSQQRFVSMFEAVRQNFTRLVPRLFGGGKADLELLDPARPLDSGVEIIARPPGKKLKSIELLSGGEKALCATALIFSIFLERPSPLCVLDEVDAPLDEANLTRFLALIKDMSARTQFLMITHNKLSMSVSDNLVGVTMQEPGASKMISVSLQEAYSQVA